MRYIPRIERNLKNDLKTRKLLYGMKRHFCYISPITENEDTDVMHLGGYLTTVEIDDQVLLKCNIVSKRDSDTIAKFVNNEFRLSFPIQGLIYSFYFILNVVPDDSHSITLQIPDKVYQTIERFHPRITVKGSNSEYKVMNISMSGIQIAIKGGRIKDYEAGTLLKATLQIPQTEQMIHSFEDYSYTEVFIKVIRADKKKDHVVVAGEYFQLSFYSAIHLDTYIYRLSAQEYSATEEWRFRMEVVDIVMPTFSDKVKLFMEYLRIEREAALKSNSALGGVQLSLKKKKADMYPPGSLLKLTLKIPAENSGNTKDSYLELTRIFVRVNDVRKTKEGTMLSGEYYQLSFEQAMRIDNYIYQVRSETGDTSDSGKPVLEIVSVAKPSMVDRMKLQIQFLRGWRKSSNRR